MATSMEAATVSLTTAGTKGPRQFQGLFDIIPFKFSMLETTNIGAEDCAVGTVAVPGAELGDFVIVTPAADVVSIMFTAYVSAADVVTVYAQNLETADVNSALAAAVQFNGLVLKPKSNVLAFSP